MMSLIYSAISERMVLFRIDKRQKIWRKAENPEDLIQFNKGGGRYPEFKPSTPDLDYCIEINRMEIGETEPRNDDGNLFLQMDPVEIISGRKLRFD